jgi:hypothetical protein
VGKEPSGPVPEAISIVSACIWFGPSSSDLGRNTTDLHLGLDSPAPGDAPWLVGELPMTPFGWRLMGSTVPGMGADQLTQVGTALAWLLIGVSAVDAATGRWLWQDRRRGRVVGLATTPVNFGLGLLFQVPFLIVVPPLRAGLLIVGSWRRSSEP